MIRIAIADDHQLFRKSLQLLLNTFDGVDVLLEAESGEKLLESIATTDVDLVLLDLQMPRMDGFETCVKIRKNYPCIKILILSQLTTRESIHRVMDCGAHGFFSKNTDPEQLEIAIKNIRDRDFYFGADLGSVLRDAMLWDKHNIRPEGSVLISDREMDVIKLACIELSSMEIADRLNISVRTVETHRKRIMEKTESKNFLGVILYALKNKLLNMDDF